MSFCLILNISDILYFILDVLYYFILDIFNILHIFGFSTFYNIHVYWCMGSTKTE